MSFYIKYKKEIINTTKKIYHYCYRILSRYYFIFYRWRFFIIKKKIKNKNIIKVAFFSTFSSVWKYDKLYNLLYNHPKFKPQIFICPIVNYGKNNMINEMEKTYKLFKGKKYNAIKTYDSTNNKYLDIKDFFSPDIIFYSNPYKNLVDKRYHINNYKNTLSCYVPYAIMTTNNKDFYDLNFHNIVWRIFGETNMHKTIASNIQRIRGENIIITGHPGCDPLEMGSKSFKDVWKIKNRKIKRIIWAPHHLLNELNRMSNFLEYYDVFLEIANKYKDKLQIAFKPHPILKEKLFNTPNWGIEKTEKYFQKWKYLENGQYENSDYVDLFLTSDAMIHDSGSFITEYLYTGRPSLFMVRNDDVMNSWSLYGKKAISMHYQSRNKEQLESFITNVVLNDNDFMKEERMKFIKEVITPPNQKSASENILNILEKELIK